MRGLISLRVILPLQAIFFSSFPKGGTLKFPPTTLPCHSRLPDILPLTFSLPSSYTLSHRCKKCDVDIRAGCAASIRAGLLMIHLYLNFAHYFLWYSPFAANRDLFDNGYSYPFLRVYESNLECGKELCQYSKMEIVAFFSKIHAKTSSGVLGRFSGSEISFLLSVPEVQLDNCWVKATWVLTYDIFIENFSGQSLFWILDVQLVRNIDYFCLLQAE